MNETPHDPAAPGTPDDGGVRTEPQGAGPRVSSDQLRDVSRLRRPHDRRIAGVAAGLARHLDVDPLVLRIAFVVLVFFGGSGLLLYGALWLLMPEDGSAQAPLHLDERSRGIAIVGVGVLAGLLLLGDSWNLYWFPWPLALVALVVWFLFFRDRPASPGGQVPPPGWPGAQAPYSTPTPPAAGVGTADGNAAGDTGTGTWPGAGSDTGTGAGTGDGPSYAETYGGTTASYAASGQGSYAATYAPGYAPAPPTWSPPPATAPDPRKRGPLLFWFTCALAALAIGVLGIVDLAGAEVADSAYPALVLGVVAVMLLVGSVYGRAGGLVALGLVAAVATAGTLVAEQWERDYRQIAPVRAELVQDRYEIGAGELVLDLREVDDLDALDGRRVHVSGGVGRLEVILPPELDSRVTAEVGGPGNINLFGEDHGGIALEASSGTQTGTDGDDQPEITLDLELGVGQVEVRTR